MALPDGKGAPLTGFAVWLGFNGTGTMTMVETGTTLDGDRVLAIVAGLTEEIEATGDDPLAVEAGPTAETEATGEVPLAVEVGLTAGTEAKEGVSLAVEAEP